MSNKMSSNRSKWGTGASKRKSVIQGKKKLSAMKRKGGGGASPSPEAKEKKIPGSPNNSNNEEQNGGVDAPPPPAEDAATKKSSAADVLFEKFRKGEMINSQAKKIILNVFSRLSAANPGKSWKKVSEEAAELTGVSSKSILNLKGEKLKTLSEREQEMAAANANAGGLQVRVVTVVGEDGTTIVKDVPQRPQKRIPKRKRSVSPRSGKRKYTAVQKKRIERYDEAVLTSIRLKMHQFAERSEKPTVAEVLAAVNADTELPNLSKTTMKRLLEDMGLKHMLRGRLPPKGHKSLADTVSSFNPLTNKKPKTGNTANPNANPHRGGGGGGVLGGVASAGGGAHVGPQTGNANAALNAFSSVDPGVGGHNRKWQVPETYATATRPSYANAASHYSDYQLPHQWTNTQNFALRNEAHQNSL